MNEAQNIVAAFRRLKRGERAALATVVCVAGSSYRRPGARMLITESGETTGVLSAGCFERDVYERAAKVILTGEPVLVKYDTTTDDDIVWRLGQGCNGVVHVLIEPATNERVAGLMQLLAECAESDISGAVTTVFHVAGDTQMAIGTTALLYPDGTIDGEFTIPAMFDDLIEVVTTSSSTMKRYETPNGYVDVFFEVIQPRPRLVVFGAGIDVLPVVGLAQNLGWHTTVVDTRARTSSRERFHEADTVLLSRPEDVLAQVMLSERTMVVLMTHNYLHDLELLRQLLPLPLPYLGCLGPKQRTERLLLELFDNDTRRAAAQLRRLHAPVGLDIGAETPEEIALSIVSGIKAELSGRTGGHLREREGSIHEIAPTIPFTAAFEVATFAAVCEA
jgi:xanthine/CO dehydrogenase XdhC/CoxF family maturation factor